MVRVVDCHAGVLGSNPGGHKRFSPWNYFSSINRWGPGIEGPPKNRYLGLPKRLELPERLPKYGKDQIIIGKY